MRITKLELEKKIKLLEKESRDSHDLLEKHDLLPKPITLQEEIVVIESKAMVAIQDIAKVVISKTGRPFITIDSRVIKYNPLIVLKSPADSLTVVIDTTLKLNDHPLREALNTIVDYFIDHRYEYTFCDKDEFIKWATMKLRDRIGL